VFVVRRVEDVGYAGSYISVLFSSQSQLLVKNDDFESLCNMHVITKCFKNSIKTVIALVILFAVTV
jgi:hypothetical protein